MKNGNRRQSLWVGWIQKQNGFQLSTTKHYIVVRILNEENLKFNKVKSLIKQVIFQPNNNLKILFSIKIFFLFVKQEFN